MPVNFTKPAHVVVVHGVQTGTDADIDSVGSVTRLIDKALQRSHLQRDYETVGFYYEDINDEAQKYFKAITKGLSVGSPLTGTALKMVVELAGDVVTAAANTSTAKKIRRKLAKKIRESYDAGHPVLLVSHSLGTVYSLNTIAEMMARDDIFKGDNRKTWPVQGLITMGSPLGLDLQMGSQMIFPKCNIPPLNATYEVFPWHNYFNRLDPVVSGNVFGKPVQISGAKGPVETRYGADTQANQWLLHGHAVTSGKQWLLAHTAYWKNPRIGDRIVDMLWG